MKHSVTCSEIYINEICFVSKEQIHLLGFICLAQKFQPARVVCNRSVLKLLLSKNGKSGREILRIIATLLHQPHAVPLQIDLIDRFGITLPIESGSVCLLPADTVSDCENPDTISAVRMFFLKAVALSSVANHF